MRQSNVLALAVTFGFVVGLVMKYAMLSHMGVSDMNAYYEWGRRALETSLPRSYHGIYFPLQYQIFELCAWLTARLGSDFVPIFKLANLVFDAGAFFLLLLLLKQQGSNPAYALLYWLHPWLLSVFSLGYIDFQFSFFVLLSVCLMNSPAARRFLVAGIPLGLAFLMKPQAQILFVAAFLYGIFRYVRSRDSRPLELMVFPAALFLAYDAYFVISRFAELGYRSAYVLPFSYLNISNVMPCLTAHMPNLWYPVAYLLKQPEAPIYSVSDQIQVLPYVSVKYLAAASTIGLVAWHVFRVEREPQTTVARQFVDIFGFASLTVPFVMTSAHENHLFLGSVFLVLLLARNVPLSFKLAAHVLLLIQFLNVYGLYGEHPPVIARFLRQTYSQELAIVYSLVGVLCFGLMLHVLLLRRIEARGTYKELSKS